MGRRGGSGRTETAVDESRKETADRVARYRTNYVGRTYISMLLVPQTAAAASKVFLLSFGFPVPSVRSWSYSQNRRVSAYYIYDQPDPRVAQRVRSKRQDERNSTSSQRRRQTSSNLMRVRKVMRVGHQQGGGVGGVRQVSFAKPPRRFGVSE